MQSRVCASVVSYVASVLSLFVSQLSFVWCLGKVVLRVYGISWDSSLLFRRTAKTDRPAGMHRLIRVFDRYTCNLVRKCCTPAPIYHSVINCIGQFFHTETTMAAERRKNPALISIPKHCDYKVKYDRHVIKDMTQ